MTDERTLGQVLHEARRKHNPKTERPRNVDPWDQRAVWQRDLDEAMAADLAAEVTGRITAELEWHRDHAVPGVARKAWQDAIEVVTGTRLL